MNTGYKIYKGIMEFLLSIVRLLKTIALAIKNALWEKYLKISLPEKIIILNIVPAFFAIILPVARFKIFDSYFYVNNPLAVYLLGIAILMPVSGYLKNIIKLAIRLAVNLYFLFWIIYIPLAEQLTKAKPHEIYFGYYLNIAVPAVFIIMSLISYYTDK